MIPTIIRKTLLKTIRIITAHALGEGKVKDLPFEDIVAVEKKIKYIPEQFLDQV